MTWDEAQANSDNLTGAIEEMLQKQPPKSIADVIKCVNEIDKNTSALPNPNQEGQFCQLILYPSARWKTWSSTSMSISKYNLYR